MTQPPTPQPAPADALPRWTIERMSLFIETLRRTGNVAAAARAAGMSRRAAYRLRSRLPGHPFDLAWTAALAQREAFRRMTAGYDAGRSQGGTPGPTGSQGVTPGPTGSQGK
jgi:hypothetical protein